jgi:hypothetical protein
LDERGGDLLSATMFKAREVMGSTMKASAVGGMPQLGSTALRVSHEISEL